MTRHAAATSPARIQVRFELAAEERERLLEQIADHQIRRGEALSWLEWHFVQMQEGALQAEPVNLSETGHARNC